MLPVTFEHEDLLGTFSWTISLFPRPRSGIAGAKCCNSVLSLFRFEFEALQSTTNRKIRVTKNNHLSEAMLKDSQCAVAPRLAARAAVQDRLCRATCSPHASSIEVRTPGESGRTLKRNLHEKLILHYLVVVA